METKIIETPIGKYKVEIKSWITGGDRRALRNIYLNASEIIVKDKAPEIKGLSGKIIEQMEDKAIEIVVISINDKKENILNTILEMHEEDYEFIVKEINKLTAEKKTMQSVKQSLSITQKD